MQTLVEKVYEQKNGEDGLYRMLSPDGAKVPMFFPGEGMNIPIELPGPEMPIEEPLEVILGYQVPQGLYAMYSFGINEEALQLPPIADLGLPTGPLGPEPKDPETAYERLMRKKHLPIEKNIKDGIELEGGCTLTGTKNTAIIKEPLGGGFTNIYSHHDSGDGREELGLKGFGKIFDY